MRELFGITPEGKEVYLYTINNGDMTLSVINYGGSIQKLIVGGVDVVCGFDTLEDYLSAKGAHGALVGRYANRIEDGVFEIDGVEYKLYQNGNGCILHGGKEGFHKKHWSIEETDIDGSPVLFCTYFSPDGEENFPGNLAVKVGYILRDRELVIEYKAVTDKPTYVNLTNHAYFNLNGCGNGDILSHNLLLNCKKYTQVDPITLIPDSKRGNVAATPLDFTYGKKIGDEYDTSGLPYPGYDHNFVIDADAEKESYGEKTLSLAGRCSAEGLSMDIITSLPCVQVYTGNFIKGAPLFKGGKPSEDYGGVCFEAQMEPNCLKRGESRLDPDKIYHEVTIYRFS